MSLKSLAVELSKLKIFETPKEFEEQYPTDSESAATLLWNAFMQGDIEGKKVADFGAGTGILGIGALILGAKNVQFIERDLDAVKILKENLSKFEFNNFEILCEDVFNFKSKVDTVIMNPPFGTRDKHTDRNFLIHAWHHADVIYSFHLRESLKFLESFCYDNARNITHKWNIDMVIKKTLVHHKKVTHHVKALAVRIQGM